MAKFNPQNATVPPTNFEDRSSAEQFLECGKFRVRCANVSLDKVALPQSHFAYMPICLESRFEKAGIAQFMPMPVRGHPLNPITYTSIGDWGPLVSCPRKCRGYRNKYWAAICRIFQGRAALPNAQDDRFVLALSNGWVQSFGVGTFASLVALLIAISFHTGIEVAALTFVAFAIAATISFFMAARR